MRIHDERLKVFEFDHAETVQTLRKEHPETLEAINAITQYSCVGMRMLRTQTHAWFVTYVKQGSHLRISLIAGELSNDPDNDPSAVAYEIAERKLEKLREELDIFNDLTT